ncbi:hypothetical protein PMAYCL1PPCAC_07145 [Pristionchus mayeri]|uniref:RRM domain-containing protein n=1 Tax=Pristionchus mayeri TaxID=1317129 RepID=A0AAN5CAM9_9BILA|nr:hypothetical protein PMAYCL1PPCAC_07145 [Pristionchus mayeri]
MFTPDSEWRCKEDLKVILIAKQGKLSRSLAYKFFQRFGKVVDCYTLNRDTIACGVYETEENAEEALKAREIVINGMYCDVTTFKSGNRKIFLNPPNLPNGALREYFDSNYGTVLRVETLDNGTCFILFQKVDAAVACRGKTHRIKGCNIFARPGCTPGTKHTPDRSSMYRVTSRCTAYNRQYVPKQLNKESVFSTVPNISKKSPHGSSSPSFITYRSPPSIASPFASSSSSESSTNSSPDRPTKSPDSPFLDTPIYYDLLDDMKDLSFNENVVKKRKRNEMEESVIEWRRTTDTSPRVTCTVDEVWETKRKELNLPPTDPCAHYALDKEGFPLHHNGEYVHSILKDGRYRIKDNNRVSFNMEKTSVQMFHRADYEYAFFGPRNAVPGSGLIEYDDDEVEGWGDEEVETTKVPSRGGFPRDLKWPFDFPSKPNHFPLMEKCEFENEISLEFGSVVRYLHHLEARWKNTKQHNFLADFAPFLKSECFVCSTKLEGARTQFEHIFSRPHLLNLNRQKVKYSPSDFTFWHNLLLRNYDTGRSRR